MASVEIKLPYPPTVNTYWRVGQGRVFIADGGRKYRRVVETECYAQMVKGFGDKRLSVVIDVYPPDHRRRDIDNVLKATLDSLQKAGVFDDDNQIDHLEVTRREVIKKGYITVNIAESA